MAVAHNKLLYKPNENIRRADGKLSGVIYLADAPVKKDRQRKLICQCPKCHKKFTTTTYQVRSGDVTQCPTCAKTKINLVVGQNIPLTKGGISPLKFIKFVSSKNYHKKILCECPCGNTTSVWLTSVRSGETTRCVACRNKARRVDIIGQRFGRLLVIQVHSKRDKQGKLKYDCICDCGNSTTVRRAELRSGTSTSCGCRAKKLTSERMKSNWKPGTSIGAYLILEDVTQEHHTRMFYRVFDNRSNTEKIMSQSFIKTTADDLGYFTHICRSRLRAALNRKRIPINQSVASIFTWTEKELKTHLGPKPGPDFNLDHICPLKMAKTCDEVIALFALSNLQWIPRCENINKSSRWTPKGAALHEKLLKRKWEK